MKLPSITLFSKKMKTRPAFLAMLATFLAVPLPSAAQEAMIVDSTGNVGIGVDAPKRQLHLRGNLASFRMDRNVDGASFFLVRTDSNWNTWKTFQVGVVSSGPNNGEFIINDLGQAVGGTGVNRMTITNSGQTNFTGVVTAPSFNQTSASRFKENIASISDAGSLVERLRGVRFTWKDSGQPSVGLVAEEVAEVIPELVQRDDDNQPNAVNYAAMVAVLIEAYKAQQVRLTLQEDQLSHYRSEIAAQTARISNFEARLQAYEEAQARLLKVEGQGIRNATQAMATALH